MSRVRVTSVGLAYSRCCSLAFPEGLISLFEVLWALELERFANLLDRRPVLLPGARSSCRGSARRVVKGVGVLIPFPKKLFFSNPSSNPTIPTCVAKIEIPFPFFYCFFFVMNSSPSAQNPISQPLKKTNPSSHFTSSRPSARLLQRATGGGLALDYLPEAKACNPSLTHWLLCPS